ncbi:major facilitator superfamily domain-containing protein [Mycena sp. CBHHK59/15]|nr:major facilitator superfamily domain-containing protein [Mycena sp. CBHHK59/15]
MQPDTHLGPERSDESCPLLADHGHFEAHLPSKKKAVPIPRAQLAALCISRLTEPVAYSQIFLTSTSFDSAPCFYSGLVESVYAVTQSLTSYYWAKLSDVIGRRPIILLGSICLAIFTLLLGFCTSLTQIMVLRALGILSLSGFMAGNLAVYHAVLGEITDTSNQAIAYPLYAFTWPFGGTIGPLIGGSFSNLGTKYPKFFGYAFLVAYPYFMPGFICSLLVMVGFCLAYFLLEETLPSKRKRPTEATDQPTIPSPSVSAMELLSIPMMRALTASAFALGFIGTAFDVVTEIGYALAMSGAILAIFQLFLMPTLLRNFNAAKMYNFCMRCWPVTFVLTPFLNFIVRNGYDEDSGLVDPTTNALLWIGVAVVLMCSRIAALAYATNMILIRNHAPSPSSLGATNGLVQVAMCVSRCFSPAFVSTTFALSVGNNFLGGYPIWVVVMLCICLVGCYFSQKMVAMDEKSLK